MSYVVLALKWRPQTFDEVAGQEPIAQTLKNAIRTGRTAHAYLFTGPRGVGKTSTARILAKALNCAEGPTPEPCNHCDACREITGGRALDVLEIDGASNRGIDDIRELRESVRYAPASTRTKVYIIDEVHMLTTDAFNALLKTLEEPPAHVVFVLCTTEPLKVPATIVSRCQRYDFARLRVRDTLGRLRTIVEAEGIAIEEDALNLIARRAEGSMRDALTLCDQVIASGRSPLDTAGVAAALGIAGRDLYFALSEAIIAQDPRRALALLTTAYDEGQNLQEVAEELIHHLRNLLLISVGPEMADLLDATDQERESYAAQAAQARPADLIRQLHIAMETASRMRRSSFPRVLLGVALAEISLLPRAADLAAWLSDPAAAAGSTGGGGHANASAPEAPASPGDDAPPAPGDPWSSVVHLVRRKRPALSASLNGSRVVGEEGGYLKIRFPSGAAQFQREALDLPENRAALQAAILKAYGRPVGWKVDAGAAPDAEPGAGATPGAQAPGAANGTPGAPNGARSNLKDIQRIAQQMDGEILGPA